MNIFISWSGTRSRALAEVLHGWLQRVLGIKPFMSSEDIEKGKRWSDIITRSLEDHDVGIICVTPENTKSPWLLFEAGAISKNRENSRTIPLLLGLSPNELDGPLKGFQATTIQKKDVRSLVHNLAKLNGESKDVVDERFEMFWPKLENKVKEISKMVIPGNSATIQSVLSSISRYGLDEPQLGSQVSFGSGFESHMLYSVALEEAIDRLWIFGRKNRKLFDKEHRDHLIKLADRVKKGFDFRVLFLSIDSPKHVLDGAHLDEDFKLQLEPSQNQAWSSFEKVGLEPSKHCRAYNITRTMSMVIVDDAIVYAPIKVNNQGVAKRMTKASFSIINSTSPLGEELLESFQNQWEAAHSLPKPSA